MVASADFDPRAAEYALNLQSSSDGVIVPGGDWLLTAEFARKGQDLTIRGADGVNAVVPDYFAGDAPPPLITDSGARLEGALVETLAGPRAPLQFADLQLAQASDATGAIGRVTAIEGVVQVSRADGSQAQLAEGDAVFLRDVIQAAADGKISIEFVDGTSFALSDGARMTLDELVFNPGGGNTFSASVLQGTFVFLTGQIAPSGEMNVTTPVGTIGVRGTKVVCKLAVEGQESTIMLLVDPDGHVGRVEVINGAGSQILSQANQATRVVSFFVAPSEPVILSEPELLQLFDEAIRMLDRSNGTTPGNEDQGGSSADPESGDTAENAEQQLDEAAEALGEFETAAGEPTDLPQTFVPLPDFSFPDAPATTSFTTVTAGGDIQYASASYGDDSSGGDWQPADTRDTEEASAPPPPPPPSPYTVISGGSGDDTLGGGASSGQLQIFGNAGNDTLSGGTQADKLDGGDGDDTLDAGPGDDVVQGGSGNDLIIGGSGEGDDQLDGGANVDTVKYQSASQDIDVNLTTGKASGDPLIGNDTLINIENVLSGGGNDTIAGNGVANLLDGGAGDDKLAGLAGDDTLIGGAGDDQLAGGAGNDLLQGGIDDDTAIVSGNRSDYTVSLIGGQLVLTDQRPGGDGVDTLDGIESVQFADQTVTAVDLLGAANDAPTAILLSNDVVAEGAAGAVIGAVTVLDPDGGDTHTFTLSDDRFQIVGGQLVLAPGKSLDFEAEPTVSLEITATDAGGLSHSQTFTIHAADVNEAPSTPVDANAALDQVAENAANGTAVGIVASASDPESGDTVTYSLTDDAGGRFAIDANTGVVTVADGSLLNFETDSSHQITVQASSSGGLASTQDFTINVTNVNEPPGTSVDGNGAANQVAENAAAGTAVGITASASDPDSGDVVTYSLIDDAGGRFVIDANTGVITVADGGLLNFEAATSHQITVQASSSGGLTSSQSFTIAVTNVNEAPGAPVDVNAVANAVAEGAANGTPVGITVSATDPDAGDTVTYSLLDDAGGRFAIDANTGIVTVADGSLLNAADAASHEITVLASSSDGLSSSQSFTIAVTNVNEPPSIPVDNDGTVNQVAENAAPGALVGLTALSIDPDPSDPVVYSLTDDAGGRFAIDANTGVVTVANGASLDFEAATSHQITVQASSSGGLSASQTFTIDVTNVNEPPSPILDDDDTGNNVAENAASGTVVGITALASDPDAADPVIYALTNDAGGRFVIEANTGVVTVADGADLDFEDAASHQITIKATSSGGLSSVENFVITVGNVNEAPEIVSDGGDESAAVSVAENTKAVTTIQAQDPDSGDSATYAIVGGVDSSLFEIDANTGALSFIGVPDFEDPQSYGGGQSYEVVVRATDGGGKFDEQIIAVTVEDTNEAPAAPIDADDSPNIVAENAAPGTAVGITAQSLDVDLGDAVTYSLTDDAGGRFAIDANTGEVSVADGSLLNYEDATSHQITVKATSGGGLNASQSFTINLSDVNELPSVPVDADGAPNLVAENAVNGTAVGVTASSIDPDLGDAVTYSLTDDAGGRFAIDANTGVITVADGSLLDFEAATSHQVTVQASSSGGLSASQTFIINVGVANEPPGTPVDGNAAVNQVAENAAAGTLVGITATATDPDLGDVVTYSLTDDAGGRFAIDADTGVVTVADGGLLNFENATSHQITVQASSSGGLTSSQDFTIAVTNVNEAPGTPIDTNGGANAVAENAANGTPVGITVAATDPDAGDTVTYSLTDDAGGRFAIDANTGVVTVADGGSLNFEGATSHQITVQAISSGGLTSSQSFTIAVNNVNEAPGAPVDGNGAVNTVAENAANGTPVGITAAATDPDAGDTVTYSLTDDAGGRFAIDANTGVVTVANGTLLNFENATSHQITVQATSSGGLSSTQAFTIAVTDVNEPPNAISDGNAAANSVAENAAAGAGVGITVLAADPDAGDPVTYTLTNDAGGRFAIDANTGVVTVANGGLLDFEAATSHQITVKATSSGGLASFESFVINVGDMNEVPSTPVDANGALNLVTENAPDGTLVGITASSTDPDAGDDVTYSLLDDAGGRFAIDPVTGVVSVADGSLLAEGSYDIVVQASSSGGLSASQTFSIGVADGNDGPVLTASTLSVAQGAPDLVHESELLATDSDTPPSQIVYTLAVLPVLGVLLLNEVELGLGETFTQQDIADGNLKYLTPNAGADSFTVDITDGANALLGQTIQVNVVSSGVHTDGDVGEPNVSDPLIVGDTAFGRLNVIGGGEVAAASGVIVGNNESGDGIVWVSGTESKLTAGGFGVEVAKAGSGLALVTADGLIETTRLTIGVETGGLGNLSLIGGTLRTLGTDNGVFVGSEGVGILQVESGGQVTALQMVLGDKASGVGMATISGTGSQVVISNDDGLFSVPDQGNAGQVVVGEAGLGDLQVLEGGHLEIRSGASVNTETTNPLLAIGHQEGSSGIVTIGGAGSTLELSMTAAADPGDVHELLRGPGIAIGLKGDGVMLVKDGAAVSLDGDEAFIAVGVGNYLDAGDTTPYPGGSLTIATGGQVALTDFEGGEGGLIVGDFQSGSGVVNVAGTGSLLSVDSQGGAVVGREGTGTFNVLAGGKVEIASDGFNNLVIGEEASGEGQVTVSGAGSTLSTTGLDNAILVGDAGKGDLEVSDGGSVTTLYLAVGRYGDGTATIDGAGSKVVVSNDGGNWSGGDAIYGGWVNVAQHAGSTGSLTIQDGGTLEIRDGVAPNDNKIAPGMQIGGAKYSTGIVEVTGAGSSIDISMSGIADENDEHPYLVGPAIIVGGRGEGTLLVSDQAKIQITGNEAYLDVGLGNSGHPEDPTEYYGGTLVISGGATVEVIDLTGGKGGLLVGDWQGGNGAVTVTGAGSLLAITSEGGADIGNDGTGELIVSAGGTVTVHSDNFNNLNVGNDDTASGKVLVTGAGSSIITSGFDNSIQVGRQGTGSLTVEDGALVKTLTLQIGREGSGNIVIDGDESKIIVSNDEGVNTEPYAYEAGFVRVSRNEGSYGSLKIMNGGELEIRSGIGQNEDTYGAALAVGRNKGSSGHVLVSGAGSLISITQDVVPTGDLKDHGPSARVNGNSILTVQDQGQIVIEGVYASLGVGDSRYADASLEVIGGGSILVDNKGVGGGLWIGGSYQGAATGAVHVGGTGSSLILEGDGNRATVGHDSKGSLLIDGGGLVQADSLSAGQHAPAEGKVTVSGSGSSLQIDGAGGIQIGADGSGELHVTGGAKVFSTSDNFNNLDIASGNYGSGWVTVDGAGSLIQTFGVDNTVQVGRYGTGKLDVTNGGVVSTAQFEVGRFGEGVVNIDGAGSKVIASNDGGLFSDPFAWEAGFVRVGRSDGSHGEIHITNGGVLEIRPGETVNTDTFGAELLLGHYAGSTGIVTVSGSGSAIVVEGKDSIIEVGHEGSGSLSITDGAQATAQFVQFGRLAGSEGTGLISGAGSKLNAAGLDSGISVGRYGAGTLTIAAGGYATTDFVNIGRGDTGNGTLNVTGMGSVLITDGVYSGMNVGREGTGALNITAGGLVQTKDVNIGHFSGSQGTALVSGAGSKLVVEGEDAFLGIGQEGTGLLKVEAGGEVETLWINVGGYGTGELSIDGAGSKVVVSNDSGLFSGPDAAYAGGINVGRDDGSNGELSVTNGGTLEVRPGQVINTGTTDAEIVVARNAGSSGEVIVDGAGSSISVSGPGSSLIIGREGNGSLSITDGGVVNAGFIQFGTKAGAEGTGLVSGAGSELNGIVDESLNVGRYGHGVLTVSSGGSVTGTYIHLGRQAGGTGEVVVTGSGSQLIASGSNGGTVSVGRHGVGDLTVAAGGLVRGDWMNVGSYAGSAGEVLVTGAGSRFESVDGEMNIGRYGSGTVTVQNGATMGANTVAIGHFAGSDGKALVNGVGSQLVTEGTDNAIQVGREGTGILAVQNGGTVKTLALIVGREGDGTVTIEGAGSAIIVSNDEGLNGGIYAQEAGFVRVARNDGSDGKLEITSGGLLEIRPGLTENTDTVYAGMSVGKESGSSGHVLVSGMGSKIRIYQDAVSPAGLGAFAGAFLSLQADSDLKVLNNAQVTIEGPGSSLGVGGQYGGHATLEVLTGGSILLDGKAGEAGIFVGGGSGTGSVLVSGPASTITVTGDTQTIFHVGYTSEASLVVTAGGSLHVGDAGDAITAGIVDHNEVDVQIFSHGTLDGGQGWITGDVFIDKGAVLGSGDGTVAPMTIQGDFLCYEATIEIDAQGHQFADYYDVSGEALILPSIFEFSFLSGYLPQDGNNFVFLHAGEGIGIDFNNMQYILHNITAGGIFAFDVTTDGTDLTFNSYANTSASDGLLYRGSDNADIFSATAGADELYGRDGNDMLSGGGGNDWIVGGYGDDNLDGGADADQFFYDAPWYQTYVATNQLVSASGQTGDLISNFDATVTGGDQFVFDSIQFDVLSGISNLNFSVIATEYNGSNGTSADYLDGEASFILDSENHLIYDDNGTADGYTVIATVDLASGSPPITADNLQAA